MLTKRIRLPLGLAPIINSGSLRFERFALAALILLGAMKNDAAAMELDDIFSALVNHSLINTVKANISLLYLPVILAVAYAAVRTRSWHPRLVPLILPIAGLFFLGAVRASLVSNFVMTRALGSAVLAIVVGLIAMTAKQLVGSDAYRREVNAAILYASYILVGLNLFNVLAGYGFAVGGSTRLIGTAAHAQFLGMQMGIAAGFFAIGVYSTSSRWRIAFVPWAAAAIYLEALTGSRTGLVMGGLIFLTYTLSADQRSRQYSYLAIATLGAGYVVYWLAGSALDLTTFNRPDNTRYDAWSSMFAEIIQQPFLGSGRRPLFSESSYLRMWATFGIFFPLFYLFIIYTAVVRLNRSRKRRNIYDDDRKLLALAIALAIGGVFEGFFMDTISSSFVCWLLAASAVGAKPASQSVSVTAPLANVLPSEQGASAILTSPAE